MKKKSLLIVGGTGFIGGHLTDEAIKKGYDVTIIHKHQINLKNRKRRVKYLKCDIGQKSKLFKLLSNKNFNFVINTSGYINHRYNAKAKEEILNSHLFGTLNLISYFEKKNINKFVQLSTSDIYPWSNSLISETKKQNPKSLYAFAKLSVENYLSLLFKINKFPYVCFRIFTSFGEHQKSDRLIPSIITDAIQKKKIVIKNPNQIRDFIYVKEIAETIIKNLNNSVINGHIINLGSGKGIKLKKIAKLICDKFKHKNFEFVDNKKNIHKEKLVANISKAKKILKWSPKKKFSDYLDITIEHYKNASQ